MRLLVAVGMLALLCVDASAASSWSGSIKCSWGSGSLSLTIDDNGTVSGRVTNGEINSGRLSGSSIQFSTTNFFGNRASFSGTASGSSMSGKYTQSVTGETCSWYASRTGGGVPGRQATKPAGDPNGEACQNVQETIDAARKVEAQIKRLAKSPKEQLRGCTMATDGYNDLEQIVAAHCPPKKAQLRAAMARMNGLLCSRQEYESYRNRLYRRDTPSGDGGVRG